MTSSPSYETITLILPSPDWEICEALLHDHCSAVSTFMDPDSSGCWTLVGIFEKKPDADFASAFLQEAHSKGVYLDPEDLVITPLENIDWLRQISLDFPAFSVENFWIHGTHISENCPKDHLELIINAATAFGSGEHETTKGCLILLKALLDSKKITMNGPRVLDMGCGSGILLIALATYLVHQNTESPSSDHKEPFLLGVDSDPEAISVSIENGVFNQVSSLVSFQQSTGFETMGSCTENFDLIFANIVLSPLQALRDDFRKALKPEGYLILSGLLQTQVDGLLQGYLPLGFELIESTFLGEWASLLLQKTP